MSFRVSSWLVLASVSLALVGCPKKDDGGKDKSASSDEKKGKKKKDSDDKQSKDDDKAGDDDDKPKGKGGSGCKVPETIEADFTITKGCKVKVAGNLGVRNGATLTIEEGVRMSFGPNTYLTAAEGKLVAKGSADAPIVFTSADESPNPGDWVGILFEGGAKSGNVIDHAKIEYAGKSGNSGEAAITLYGEVGSERLSITNVVFENNDSAGVKVQATKSRFAKFEGNQFKGNKKVAMDVPADIVDSIGKNKFGGEKLHVQAGEITHSCSWPKIDADYVVDGNLTLKGDKEAPVLTLPDGATVAFAANAYLWIGDGQGGGLQATNVTFTSAAVTPDEGDWVGLLIGEKVIKTKLDGCTISYAGKAGNSGLAAITFYGDITAKKAQEKKRVEITGLSVKKSTAPAFSSSDADCGDFASADSKNKTDGDALCAK